MLVSIASLGPRHRREPRLNCSWDTAVSNSICARTGEDAQVKGFGVRAKARRSLGDKAWREGREGRRRQIASVDTVWLDGNCRIQGQTTLSNKSRKSRWKTQRAGKKKRHISTHLGLRVRRQPLVGQFLLHQISTGSSLICHTFQEEAIKSWVRHFWSVSSSAILPQKHSCKLGGSAEKKKKKNWAMLQRPSGGIKNAPLSLCTPSPAGLDIDPAIKALHRSTAESRKKVEAAK